MSESHPNAGSPHGRLGGTMGAIDGAPLHLVTSSQTPTAPTSTTAT
ncbi:MAG: hypothetical protein ACKVIQ_05255 [Acidimicrobiales bacterium]